MITKVLRSVLYKKVLMVGDHVPYEKEISRFGWHGNDDMRWFGITNGVTLFRWLNTGWHFPELRITRPSELRPDLRVLHLSVGRFSIVYHPK